MKAVIKFFTMLGPGLLWAGAAVGVSHLVQSTQAGARFGFTMLLIVILANLLKYPFFEYGPRFAASTGNTLLAGYKKLGNWAFYLYLLLTLSTMFIIQGVVTIVTAGLVIFLFDLQISAQTSSIFILISSAAILYFGHYSTLDKLIKWVIILLTLTTVVSVLIAIDNLIDLPRYEVVLASFDISEIFKNELAWLFIIPLVGWMPAPIDVSVWHSIWTTEKNTENPEATKLKNTLLDFNIGFIVTMLIAIGFLSLGALTMFDTGIEFSDMSAVRFSATVISMYTQSIGLWSKYLVGFAALATMFSTTITCLDAYGRVMAKSQSLIKNQHDKDESNYFSWIIITVVGAIAVLYTGKYLGESLPKMVAFATTVSFLTAPILGYLNMRVVNMEIMPIEARPGWILIMLSRLGLVFLSIFSFIYLYGLFFKY